MRNVVVQLGVPICDHCQILHSMISSFGVAPCGLYSKHSLRVYIIQYSNLGTMNASSSGIRWSVVVRLNCACGLHSMVTCMCCNGSKRMELLGTVVSSPACSNSWNSCLEHDRPHCNLLDTLVCSNLAT
jgi:hypothetical protein